MAMVIPILQASMAPCSRGRVGPQHLPRVPGGAAVRRNGGRAGARVRPSHQPNGRRATGSRGPAGGLACAMSMRPVVRPPIMVPNRCCTLGMGLRYAPDASTCRQGRGEVGERDEITRLLGGAGQQAATAAVLPSERNAPWRQSLRDGGAAACTTRALQPRPVGAPARGPTCA